MRAAAARPSAAGVELGAGPAQRQVDLGGQYQDGQGRAQGQRAVQQAQSEEERHEGGAHRGHGLERQGRQEGDLEGRHRLVVEFRVGPLEGVAAVVGPSEGPQGGQALEEVVEGGGQPGQPGPLPVGVPGGLEAEQDHEHRDDGHRHGQDHGGEPVPTARCRPAARPAPGPTRTTVGRYRAK